MGAPGATPPAPGKPVTLDAQVAAVIREIGMRKRVYPSWVGKGRMKPEQADHELLAMEAVLATVRDYQAMQPKVLALSAAVDTLAEMVGLTAEQKDVLLVQAEKDAVAALAFAKEVKDKVVAAIAAPAWPFRREPMP